MISTILLSTYIFYLESVIIMLAYKIYVCFYIVCVYFTLYGNYVYLEPIFFYLVPKDWWWHWLSNYFYNIHVKASVGGRMYFIQMVSINTVHTFYDFSIHPSATNTNIFKPTNRVKKKSKSEKSFDRFGSCINGYKTQLLIYKPYWYAIKTWNSHINQDKLAICIYMQYCFQTFTVKYLIRQ